MSFINSFLPGRITWTHRPWKQEHTSSRYGLADTGEAWIAETKYIAFYVRKNRIHCQPYDGIRHLSLGYRRTWMFFIHRVQSDTYWKAIEGFVPCAASDVTIHYFAMQKPWWMVLMITGDMLGNKYMLASLWSLEHSMYRFYRCSQHGWQGELLLPCYLRRNTCECTYMDQIVCTWCDLFELSVFFYSCIDNRLHLNNYILWHWFVFPLPNSTFSYNSIT